MTRTIIMIDWFLKVIHKIASKINMWSWKKQVHRKYYKNGKQSR